MKQGNKLVGKYIGSYQVVAEITQKPLFRVYQGQHGIFTDQFVMLKIFNVQSLPQPDHQSFAEEVRKLAQLKHPFILPLVDAGIYEEHPYIATAYAPNGSLRAYLSRTKNQRLPLQEALQILSQVGQALHKAHQHQIVHGNLKPENILFDANNNACLADFLLLTSFPSIQLIQNETPSNLIYMSPEQCQGVIAPQSDQYALGCIAYELITGSCPIINSPAAETTSQNISNVAQPNSPPRISLPIHIEEACHKALEKDPGRRHVNIFAFLAALGITEMPFSPSTIPMPFGTSSEPVSTHSHVTSSNVSPMTGSMSENTPSREHVLKQIPQKSFFTLPVPQKRNAALPLSSPPLFRPRTIAREKMTAEQLLREGMAYLNAWRYQEALSSYQQAIQRDPNAAEGYCGKGNALRELNHPEDALAAYEEALQVNSLCSSAYEGKGWVFYRQKHLKEALEVFEQAIQLNPTAYKAYTGKHWTLSWLEREEDATAAAHTLLSLCQKKRSALPIEAYYAQGMALEHLDRSEEAIRTFQYCISLNSGYLDAYKQLGLTYWGREEHENELAMYEQALLINPECTYFHKWKVSALLDLGRYREAIEAANWALKLDPKQHLVYNHKGEALLHLDQYTEALSILDQAIQLSPTFVVPYAHKAEALTKLQRYAEALEAYEQAVLLTSGKVHYYWQKAELLAKLNRNEDAIATYDQFIELHPQNFDGYRWKLYFLSEYELYEEGLATCERCIAANPHLVKAHWWRGRMLSLLNRDEESLAAFEDAIGLDPKDLDSYRHKARILADLKRTEEALQTYDQAIHHAPTKEKIDMYKEKAKLFAWLKRYAEELDIYNQIIRLIPKDASVYYHKGVVHLRLAQNEEALEAFERSIKLNPKSVRAYVSKGELLLSFERHQEALEASEKALRLDPEDAMAYFLKEKALKSLGREEEAKVVHKQGFDLLTSAIKTHIGASNARYERKQQKQRAT